MIPEASEVWSLFIPEGIWCPAVLQILGKFTTRIPYSIWVRCAQLCCFDLISTLNTRAYRRRVKCMLSLGVVGWAQMPRRGSYTCSCCSESCSAAAGFLLICSCCWAWGWKGWVALVRQKAKGPKVAGWGWVFSGLPVGYKRRRRKRKASEPPLKSECVYRECVLRAEKLTLALAKLHKYPWIKTHLLGETLKTLWKYLLIQSRSLERAACLQGKLPEFVCHP